MLYNAPCSAGDLVDRITILEIKVERLPEEKRAAAQLELEHLYECADGLTVRFVVHRHYLALKEINEQLWVIEDSVRAYIRRGDLGKGYTSLTVQVPQKNDERARLKRIINQAVGSTIVEMKSHEGL